MSHTRARPIVGSLEQWSRLSWSNGVQVDALAPLDTLVVTTRNSVYELSVIAPATGEVVVRGGRFFPTATRARVSGSSLGGGCLKLRGIYVGFLLEFAHAGRVVRTTRVQTVGRTSCPTVH
jgi:hypothetical protein